MADLNIKMTSEEQAAEKGLEKLRKKNDQLMKSLKETRAQAKAAEAELIRMGGSSEKVDELNRRIAKLEKELAKVGNRASIIGPKMISGIASAAAGYLSVSTAVNAISSAHDNWRNNIDNIAVRMKGLIKDMTVFAAMQSVGTKSERIGQILGVGARHGVTDSDALFNTVQAIQSSYKGLTEEQAFKQGLSASEVVFAAAQMGIPYRRALQLETQGALQGAKPGQFIRKAYIAGEASATDPETVALAAGSLLSFEDKDFGFGVAAVIAEAKGEQTPQYLRAAGHALYGVSRPEQEKFFKKHGLGTNATQQQRLEKLAELGIDTVPEFAAAGFREKEVVEALQFLVTNIGSVRHIQGLVAGDADPLSFFFGKRAQFEAEVPAAKLIKEGEIIEAGKNKDVFSQPGSLAALSIQNEEKLRARALARLGIESVLGISAFSDEKGERTSYARLLALEGAGAFKPLFGYEHLGMDEQELSIAREMFGSTAGSGGYMSLENRVAVEQEQIKRESGLSEPAKRLEKAAAALERAAEKFDRIRPPQTLQAPDRETPRGAPGKIAGGWDN